MKTIELTKGKVALVDDSDYQYLNQWNWYAMETQAGIWYAQRSPGVLMHRAIMNAKKGTYVDHRSGDGLDNRRENLRICTNAENSRNRKMQVNNTTGYRGVSWNKACKKYESKIQVSMKTILLGYFQDSREAARAYDEAARKHFGEFARLNFQ